MKKRTGRRSGDEVVEVEQRGFVRKGDGRVGRRLGAEVLEARLPLSGDSGGNAWQNPLNPMDVNADGFVSPIDVLTILNELNLNGPRSLSGAPGKLDGTRPASEEVTAFFDVNGDSLLSAMDALTVINALNTKQREILVRFRVETANSAGDPIAEISAGQGFLLRVYVQDLSPLGDGVFAAYTDVTFNPSLVAPSGNLEFGTIYNNGKSGTVLEPGVIDEAGAFDGLTPLGNQERLLFALPMTAIAPGSVTFAADFAEGIGHEVLLFGRNTPVPEADVDYGQTTLMILGTGELPLISIDSVSVQEGTGGTTPAVFTVTLSAPSDTDVTVDFATSDQSAVAPDDYESAAGQVTIPAGQTSATITISVVGDGLNEPDETFAVILSNPTGALIASGTGIATILDDDETTITGLIAVHLVTADMHGNRITSVPVGGTFLLQVFVEDLRTEPRGVFAAYMDVLYDANLVTVAGNFDFAPEYPNGRSGNAQAPGTLDEVGAFDGLSELGGGRFLLFSIPFSADDVGSALFTSGPASGEDNDFLLFGINEPISTEDVAFGTTSITVFRDTEPPALSIADPALPEGNAGTTEFPFVVTLSRLSESPVTVNFSTVPGTATEDVDYLGTSGTLFFEPGETSKTIIVTVFGDTDVEANETFTVVLSNPEGASIAVGSAVGTIINDDVPTGLSGLSGTVFADVNSSGLREPAELGIPGVIVRLRGNDLGGSPVARETLTDADGFYQFDGLPAGTYEISEVQPGFFIDGIDLNPNPSAPGTAENDRYVGITLGAGVNISGYNFGERGLRAEFVSKRLFLASAFSGDLVAAASLSGAPLWISFDEGFDGPLHIDAEGERGVVGLALYDANMKLLSVTPPSGHTASLEFSGNPGRLYFLKVFGTGENVGVSTSLGAPASLDLAAVTAVFAEEA